MLRIALLASLLAVPALAQAPGCGPTPEVEALLISEYGEAVSVEAALENDAVFQLWANLETQTWTGIVKRPDGVSCVIGEGQGLVFPAPAKPATFGIGPEFDA